MYNITTENSSGNTRHNTEKEASTMKQHSKVMTIANRLVSQGMGRPAAMVKAWILVRLPLVQTKVAGVTYGRRQEALEHLEQYPAEQISVRLQRDHNNPADRNAVAVVAVVRGKGGYIMGYLPRFVAALIAPLLDVGEEVRCGFKAVTGGFHPLVSRGLLIKISVN